MVATVWFAVGLLLAVAGPGSAGQGLPPSVFEVGEFGDPPVLVSPDPDEDFAAEDFAAAEYRESDDKLDSDLLDDDDDDYDLAGISCALISGECSACAKTRGCGYCESAGVCMDSRGPCAHARPVTWHWQCADHTRWWVVVLIALSMLVSCALTVGCCLKLVCCCCKTTPATYLTIYLFIRYFIRPTPDPKAKGKGGSVSEGKAPSNQAHTDHTFFLSGIEQVSATCCCKRNRSGALDDSDYTDSVLSGSL
ncbi:putative transmembrane protein [Gregarina niphandrodes]|uniref:Transmembrane protein n=1 Tax=Gregarina niphandrodes TaxID=110365 RepID=A0A023AWX8_GRENI|nr:putative transmembrane protein [Gregarina niphandrodes]EZG43224.1 putative transmembrane protein [Gregarina niphandrodes]|eukprot:XP_011133524.1 putative transmembrane protein [Gregarina niphandrodes]